MADMDSQQRTRAEDQRRLVELLASAMDRRDEVFEIVFSSEDPDEARERIRDLLGLQDPHLSQVVLDSQVSRWTRDYRRRLHDEAKELRRLLHD